MATVTATAVRDRAHNGMSPRRLLARSAILFVSLGLAAEVARMGLAIHAVRTDPVRAAAILPDDARIAIAAARHALDKGAAPTRPPVRALVDSALTRDATLPGAIELRALDIEARGDKARAARLFALSSAISRRSLPTQLWLIQHAVDRGDVAGALTHFDIALRTSTAAPDLLFPVLMRASADPSIQAPLAQLLDRPSDWRIAFLHYAIEQGGAAGMSGIVLRMRDRGAIVRGQIDQTLIGQLVAERHYALALRVQQRFGAVRPGLVRDPSFADPRATFPFGWELADKGEAGAARSHVDRRTILAWNSLPGGFGQVATQLLMLPPGHYRLSTRTTTASTDAEAAPYWSLTCGEEGGPQIALLDQPNRDGVWGIADFTVPDGCAAQWLALTLRQSDMPNQAGAIAFILVSRR